MKDSQTFLPAREVRARYGVSDMSLWRWNRQAGLGFPFPIKINGRRFWKLAELEQFEAFRSQTQEAPRGTPRAA